MRFQEGALDHNFYPIYEIIVRNVYQKVLKLIGFIDKS